MRTTVDLPEPLLRAAKAKAATSGETLKVLFERAIAREVGAPGVGEPSVDVEYPLVRSRRVGHDFTNEELDDLLATDEAERYAT